MGAEALYNAVSDHRKYTDLSLIAVTALLLALAAIPVGAQTSHVLKTNAVEEYVLVAVESLPQQYRLLARACAKPCIRRFKTNKLQILCFKANRCIDQWAQCLSNPRITSD